MAVILRQLYEAVKDKEEIQLVAGLAGMNHVVRWVHMVEGMDISSFLEGDEVAFTTGIALKSQEELFSLVELNFKNKAAGMVINIGPYISEIGPQIISFAEEHAFPIFEVPWRVHMANIMRYFTTEINKDEQQSMEFMSALRNAVYFSQNTKMYVPSFLNLGYKKNWLYSITILEFQRKQSILANKEERRKIVRFANEEIYNLKNQARVVEDGENIILFFANILDEKIRGYLERVWKKVHKYLLKEGKVYVGMGKTVSSIEEIGKCYHQAEQVLVLQKKRNAKNQIVLYQELGLYKLLLGIEDTKLMEEYYQEHLGKLEKYDRMNETDYLYFLKQFFALGCSVHDVADIMHMHRNSVSYKLHKIEEITGFSIMSQEVRTRFIVALMIEEIQ